MDWDYTVPRDEFAPYTPGGEWISSEEIDYSCKKSPLFINEVNEELRKYHCEWKLQDSKVENIRMFRHHKNTYYGMKMEDEFSSYITQHSEFTLEKTSEYDDHIHRTDFILIWKELKIPIDVKALKCVRNSRHQNKFLWVELHKNGFLFAPDSRSTLIAIEVDYKDKRFVFLDKSALKTFILEKYKGHSAPPVMDAAQAFERVYRRKGEKYEWLSFLNLNECIEKCAVLRI
jgi:hypothetical protein